MNESRAIVAIAGPSASGKSTLASYLQLLAGEKYGGTLPTLRLSLADSLRKVLCLFAPEYAELICCREQSAKAVEVYGHTIREHLVALDPYIKKYQPEFVRSEAEQRITNFFHNLDGPGLVVVDDVRRVKELNFLARLVRERMYQVADTLVVVLTSSEAEDAVFEKEVYDWKVRTGCGVVIEVDARGIVSKGFEAAQRCAGNILEAIAKE